MRLLRSARFCSVPSNLCPTADQPLANPAPDQATWETRVRAHLRKHLPARCNLGPDKTGQARLQQRFVKEDGRIKSVSVPLPYAWSPENEHDLIQRLRVIANFMAQGEELRPAATLANGASSEATYNWPAIAAAFEKHKREHGAGVSETTWRMKYAPVVWRMVDLMQSQGAPANSPNLLEAAVRQWDLGSRSRQIATQNGAAFLRYAVERQGVSARSWAPPHNLATVVGRRAPTREQFALSDGQVIRLAEALQSIGSDEANRWAFAVRLSAVYGLRPTELFHLRFKGAQLWCDYRKKSGGGTTRPRQLLPAPVLDLDGTPMEWQLEERLRAGERLPQVVDPCLAGDRMGRFLRRQTIWQQLCEEADHLGEELVPYSLRHRYSATCHRNNVPPKYIAEAMGHSLETHLRRYARFVSHGAAAAAFEAAFGGGVTEQDAQKC
jgi:integrase